MHVTSDQAIELAHALLGDGIRRCQPFGAGKFSQTFSVSGEDGGRFVLRIAPPDSVLQLFHEYRMMRQEPGIHRRLLKDTRLISPEGRVVDFQGIKIYLVFIILSNVKAAYLRIGTHEHRKNREEIHWHHCSV